MSFFGKLNHRSFVVATAWTVAFLPCAADSSVQADSTAQWPNAMPDGTNAIAKVFQAISGNVVKPDMQDILRGVTTIERQPDAYLLSRSDGQTLLLHRGTEYGDRILDCMDKVEKDAGQQLCPKAAEFVHNVNTLVVNGDEIELRHSGKESVVVAPPETQSFLPAPLKELRVKTIRLHLDEKSSPPKIFGLEGVEGVISAAPFPVSIKPREYSRWKDSDDNTHVDFGIASLIPAPIRLFTGLPDVMRFSITLKKK